RRSDAPDVLARRLSDAVFQRRPAFRKTDSVLLDAGARIRTAGPHGNGGAATRRHLGVWLVVSDVPDWRAPLHPPRRARGHADSGDNVPFCGVVAAGADRHPGPFLDDGGALRIREIRAIG